MALGSARMKLISRVLHNTPVISDCMAELSTESHHQLQYGGVSQHLWGIVSDTTIKLRDFHFRNHFNNLPSMPSRRAACTHLTVLRLYGEFRCAHCNRTSRMGWVYKCSQDDHERAVQPEEKMNAGMKELKIDSEGISDSQYEEIPLEAVKLKPWMEKAILEGHYTADEITILRCQRQKVITTIAAAENEFATRHKSAPTPPRSTSLFMAPACETIPYPQATQDSAEDVEVKEPLVVCDSAQVPKLISDCVYQSCQVCRPILRDRAWQHIGRKTDSPVAPETPDSSDENRPISDANLVRCLGLYKPKAQHGSMNLFLTNEEQDHELATDEDRTTDDTSPEGSQTESEPQKSTAMGIRAGARSAVRNMMARPRQDSTDSRASKESKNSGKWSKRRESVRDSVLKKYVENFGRDIGDPSGYEEGSPITYRTWRNASGSSAKKQKQERGSGLRVNNGVALTEEAVDLGTADIIMQA